MQLSKTKKKALRNTVAGNAVYSREFENAMPLFREVTFELAMLSDRLFTVAVCGDPEFETVDDVRKARDEVADRMIALMQKWKTA